MQDTDLPEKIEPTSLNLQTELAAQLAELVPEAMSDGKLDVTKLREMVNGDAENSPEKFGLFWPGKRAAQALAQIPTTATLVPAPDESVDWDTTKNIFIEGDNLEVLKALQNSYRRKVKMIYIDPPYNTGKEFIYPDKFSEGLQGYLEYTGQKNEAGENVESKPETGGRKHSNWLSMMYPRLQLAKSLLTDDGVIFMSIDDHEATRLNEICDEIFGNDNFIAKLVWQNRVSPANDAKWFSGDHEYILVYARHKDKWYPNRIERTEKQNSYYKNPDNDPRGPWNSAAYTCNKNSDERPNLYYPITHPVTGEEIWPRKTAVWAYSKETHEENVKNNLLYWGADGNSKSPRRKQFLTDAKPVVPRSVLNYSEVGSTQQSTLDFLKLFEANYVQYTKPKDLIARLIRYGTGKDDTVLDFFAGSGTTGHSVMQVNAEDDGNRIHIQVQLPEIVDQNTEAYKSGYRLISDLTKERIRRAGKMIREDYADKIAQRSTPLDTGFRVYKLAPSNFVQWDESKAKDDIQQSVLDFAANKKPDAAPESLLTEIMLQARMPLSANIEKRDLQNGGWVYVVDGGNLIAYVADEQITEAQANEIADLAPAKLIVLDSAFNGNNALKINVMNICKEKFIKEFKTI